MSAGYDVLRHSVQQSLQVRACPEGECPIRDRIGSDGATHNLLLTPSVAGSASWCWIVQQARIVDGYVFTQKLLPLPSVGHGRKHKFAPNRFFSDDSYAYIIKLTNSTIPS